MNITSLLNNALVCDIETSSHYNNGKEVNISADFDTYVLLAKVKWVGIYSYKYKKGYYLNALEDRAKIVQLLKEHSVFISFNGEEFDYPILVNNGLMNKGQKINHVDCMKILGASNFKDRNGYSYKDRGNLMDYKFKKNSLECMAIEMKLEFQKSKIDYSIFHKDKWTEEEKKDIIFYLKNDVMANKGMFDKLWEYWMPFTDLIDWKFVTNLSWIKSSIASLTYKAACYSIGTEPTYAEKGDKIEEMGGFVLEPKYEEVNNAWIVDFSSLYPHIFSMFNLFSEVDVDTDNAWHGNDMFKVKGYYDISYHHKLSKAVEAKIKERLDLKKINKDDPMVQTLKIFLNCFSSDTDVLLADNSIKNISECQAGEIIYSINPKTMRVEKKKITKTFEYDYDGEMHHYKSNYFDFNVTPNHRFIVENKDNPKDVKFVESHEIQEKYKLPIHISSKFNYKKIINILDYFDNTQLLYSFRPKKHGRTWLHENGLQNTIKEYNCTDTNFIFKYEDIKSKISNLIKKKDSDFFILDKNFRRSHKKPILYNNKDLSYIIGIYLAEGSLSHVLPRKYENGNHRGDIYTVSLAQNRLANPEIYKKITDALDALNLKYSPGKQSIKVSGSIFYKFILNNFGKLGDKHFINKRFFDDLNLKKVFEALIDGDGTKRSRLYTTKYDCLRDDFIELCMRLGYTFCVKNDGCWRIVYNNSKNSFRKANRTINNYKGKVYCIEVEDNNTLLAGRNKKFNWSGNSLYGVARSSIFEKVHTKNCGWDCCWIGQQITDFTQKELEKYGFDAVYGDTDSRVVLAKSKKHCDRDYIKSCLKQIIKKILANVPFPLSTFNIEVEKFCNYMLFPFSVQELVDEKERKLLSAVTLTPKEEKSIERYAKSVQEDGKKIIIDTTTNKVVKLGMSWVKTRRGRKKNYCFLYEEDNELKVKLVGLPIKKANATQLGIKIFKEVLEPKILKEGKAKFSKEFINGQISEYLKSEEIMKLISREFKIKPFDSYKIPKGKNEPTGIHAQISKGYFNCGSGVINLIKNFKIGNAGKGTKYCTVEEALNANLTLEDLDFCKLYNELEPFTVYVEPPPKPKKEPKKKVKKTKKKTTDKVDKQP